MTWGPFLADTDQRNLWGISSALRRYLCTSREAESQLLSVLGVSKIVGPCPWGVGNMEVMNGNKKSMEVGKPSLCEKLRTPKWRTTLALNLASIIEKADEQVLPAMYTYVGRTFRSTPEDLGVLTFCRALSQALASPVGGIAGYYMNRVRILSCGCLLWGLMTILFSFATSLAQGRVLWVVNGIGLSMVIPTSQSLTADYFTEDTRGAAFGILFCSAAFGAMLGQLYATNLGALTILGTDGWRFVMATLGVYSMLIGFLALWLAQDPRERYTDLVLVGEQQPTFPRFELKDALRGVIRVFRVPTFILIVVQGVFGSFPWQALAYFTHYLQLLGFSTFSSSAVMSAFYISTAFGGAFGGFLGDAMGRRFPNHGRIFTCQFSVGIKLPLVLILMRYLPKDGEIFTCWMYAGIMIMIGFLGPWAAAACNNPIFAEIVPVTHRNMVYGFDRSLEGSLAALGAPLVGMLAEEFGYKGTVNVTGNRDIDLHNAAALGRALLFWLLVPWSLCLLLYSFIHCTYPKDRDNSYIRLPSEVRKSS